jgi:hypothetical protein
LDGVEVQFSDGEVERLADLLAANIGARFVSLPIPDEAEGEALKSSSPFDGRDYTFLSQASDGGDLRGE